MNLILTGRSGYVVTCPNGHLIASGGGQLVQSAHARLAIMKCSDCATEAFYRRRGQKATPVPR